MNTNTQGVALVERLRSCARELPIRAPAASNYHEAADRIEALARENAELQAKVERLERDNETYRTAFDGIEPPAQEGREAVAWVREKTLTTLETGGAGAYNTQLANRRMESSGLTVPLYTHPTPPQPAAQVVVKGMEWERGVVDWARPLPGMKYVACSTTPQGSWGWWLEGAPETRSVHPSEAEAKAAAQADYERRILSALAAPVSQEPVDAELREAAKSMGAELANGSLLVGSSPQPIEGEPSDAEVLRKAHEVICQLVIAITDEGALAGDENGDDEWFVENGREALSLIDALLAAKSKGGENV